MKRTIIATLVLSLNLAHAQLPAPWTFYPFAPAAGQSGTTAIHMNSASFAGWADGYTDLVYGSNVADTWKTPAKALGKAVGDSYDIVCLGRGGRITLTFSTPIVNGDGFDFAVFENAVGDTFLELGWVEVSSDGTHFCRFPNYYGGNESVGAFGGHSPTVIYGLASKYRQGYGTPFDLQELQDAYSAILNGNATFLSTAYKNSITANFPHLDLNNIGYVRIIDIVGDGKAKEATGRTIYDPYPTSGSAGFDLDAVGVINQRQSPALRPQAITFDAIPNQRLAEGSVVLDAVSDSGLPVVFRVAEGPAHISGTSVVFTNSGTVVVTAAQPGDDSYAPAANVLRSFVVAEQIQHIYFAPVPNLLENMTFQLHAVSSRGLPVTVEVTGGDAVTDSSNLLTTGNSGFGGSAFKTLTLRASQAGNTSTAPAADIYRQVKVVPAGSSSAPQSFTQWCGVYSIAADARADLDDDRFNNFDEFMAGTDPRLPSDHPAPLLLVTAAPAAGARRVALHLRIRRRARATLQILRCETLGDAWQPVTPELQKLTYTEESGTEFAELELLLPGDSTRGFYRALFTE